jgi:hypothetical protein
MKPKKAHGFKSGFSARYFHFLVSIATQSTAELSTPEDKFYRSLYSNGIHSCNGVD